MTRVCNVAGAAVAVLMLTLIAPAWAGPDEERLRSQLDAFDEKRQNKFSLMPSLILREIGALMRKLQGQPVPEEFHRRMARGEAADGAASDAAGFERAAGEFQAAVHAAPWRVEAYYNLGIVESKAGQYDAAMRNLKIYLAANPQAGDAAAVRKLIYQIEFRKEEAGRAKAAQQAAVEQERQEQERKRQEQERKKVDIANLAGSWCRMIGDFPRCDTTIKVSGSTIEIFEEGGRGRGYGRLSYRGTVRDRRINGTHYHDTHLDQCRFIERPMSGSVRDDMKRIELITPSDPSSITHIARTGRCRINTAETNTSVFVKKQW